jgi:dTDP-4-amino-4,6-dideoxygalactose transaminase
MITIPLVKPSLPKFEEIEYELRTMLASGRLTNFGPFSQELEQRFSKLLRVKHSLCVSNATTGLLLLLNTLPKGSEVLVPSFTFLPTVQAILWNSLIPVFVDIDIETYTISPDSIASQITEQTSAILAVHTFGNPCDIDALQDIARKKKVKLFFDSAHAFGAKHKDAYVGNCGDAEVFSLSATKLLPCGEGGVITTNSDFIYEATINRRNYGFKHNSRNCANLGLNGKITEFSAILGLKEIDSIDEEVRKRNKIAQKYIQSLSGLEGIEFQQVRDMDRSTYKDFTIAFDGSSSRLERDILMKELLSRGIEVDAYFSPAIHQMEYFQNLPIKQTNLTTTNSLEKKILSIPIYSDLSDDEVNYIINAIKDIHQERICLFTHEELEQAFY